MRHRHAHVHTEPGIAGGIGAGEGASWDGPDAPPSQSRDWPLAPACAQALKRLRKGYKAALLEQVAELVGSEESEHEGEGEVE